MKTMSKTAWHGIGIGLFCAVALGLLLYLLYGRTVSPDATGKLAFLPAMNAACNAVTTVLILQGLIYIHHGEREKHRRSMLGAFAASTLFLLGYLTYYAVHGETHFPGQGWVRPVYFSILISHIILSAVALPLVLTTFYLALTNRLQYHKTLARITYPIWLYVSITGVVVFFFLHHYLGVAQG
jgi:putative membrane protein